MQTNEIVKYAMLALGGLYGIIITKMVFAHIEFTKEIDLQIAKCNRTQEEFYQQETNDQTGTRGIVNLSEAIKQFKSKW